MGNMDSEFFNRDKVKIKDLVLVLDDGDNILDCIKQGMIENHVSKAEIIGFEGSIKNATVSYFQRSTMRNVELNDTKKVVKANGDFKMDFADNHRVFGRIRLIYLENDKTFEGILVRGHAAGELKITLQYMEA
jgi:predicted DNA-binding protein with PD1-like motif